MKYQILLNILILSLLMSCQKVKIETPKESANLLQIFTLGDTLKNSYETSFEKSEIIFDSISNIGFRLTSSYSFVPNQSASYFIRIEFDYQDKVRILDSLANGGVVFSGPIISTFDKGDTIKFNVSSEAIFDWYPKFEIQMGNSGWLKYHIFTPFQGTKVENIKIGENYIVFKFGEAGNERMGWLNIVYQDTLCYVKEGHYTINSDEDIIVGEK